MEGNIRFLMEEFGGGKQAVCGMKYASSCHNACCYKAGRVVAEEELDRIGRENVKRRRGKWAIVSKPESIACLFLDEATNTCGIEERKPFWCRHYDCGRDESPGAIDILLQEAQHDRKKRRDKPKTYFPILNNLPEFR